MKIQIIVLSLLLIAGFNTQLGAESRRDGAAGGQDPMRKAQLMMRQLSQAKAKLEAENARLKGEMQTMQAELEKLEANLSRTKGKLGKSQANTNKLTARVKNDHEKMRNLMDKYRNTVQLLRMEKANVAHLSNAVTERNEWIDKCKANNDSLYDFNLELVDRYQNKSLWHQLAQADPLTGLGDVKLEVIAEEYRYRLEDLQMANFESANTGTSSIGK